MSLADSLRFLAVHRDQIAFLRPATWRVLHTPPFGGGYAMGWIVFPDGALSHGGSNTLWYAEVRVDRAAGVVAAAAANDGDLERVTPAVGHAVLEAAAAA